jgi:hypothetical protein
MAAPFRAFGELNMIESRHAQAAMAVAAALLFLTPMPALAAYCGASDDTTALTSLAVARGLSASSRIMDIVVAQDYARVDVQSKGRLTEYYVKDCGQWRFRGDAIPWDAPAAVKARLSGFVTRDNGGTQCLNPSFVNHPSAP